MLPSLDTIAAEPARAAPCIALVVDRFDWHARQLDKEFAARGARCVPVRLNACWFATQSPSGLILDGLCERLPDAVMVRTMSGGTFEAVTVRLPIPRRCDRAEI